MTHGTSSGSPLSFTASAPIALGTKGDLPPLWCPPPGSGSAFVYSALVRLLRPDRPVYGFEAPGFDDDEHPVDSVPALAAGYLAGLRAHHAATSCHLLLGWSLGGMVAFEMALQLLDRGDHVGTLIVIDAAAPGATAIPAEADIIRQFVLDLTGRDFPASAELNDLLTRCPVDAAAPWAFAEIESAGWLPPEVDTDFLARRFTLFSAGARAVCQYAPAARYPGQVTLVRAASTPQEYHQGWMQVAGSIEEHVVAGDHHGIWSGDGLRALSDIVQQSLDRTCDIGTGPR